MASLSVFAFFDFVCGLRIGFFLVGAAGASGCTAVNAGADSGVHALGRDFYFGDARLRATGVGAVIVRGRVGVLVGRVANLVRGPPIDRLGAGAFDCGAMGWSVDRIRRTPLPESKAGAFGGADAAGGVWWGVFWR